MTLHLLPLEIHEMGLVQDIPKKVKLLQATNKQLVKQNQNLKAMLVLISVGIILSFIIKFHHQKNSDHD